ARLERGVRRVLEFDRGIRQPSAPRDRARDDSHRARRGIQAGSKMTARARLTIGYTAAITLLLIAFGLLSYALLARAVQRAIVVAVILSAFVAWILAGRAIGPIESAFDSQRRFMADASHELRTPVAILQGEVDVALARPDRDAAEYRDTLEVMQRAIRQLARIVRDLFLLARVDVGTLTLQKSRFYLDETIATSLRGARTPAQAR